MTKSNANVSFFRIVKLNRLKRTAKASYSSRYTESTVAYRRNKLSKILNAGIIFHS